MTAQLAPESKQKFWDNNGFPLAFGLLTTYAAGTTTPIATYVDSTQTTQNTNPIQLNFRGECNLWLDPTKAYKFLLQDSQGNTIPGWPIDNITIGNANPSYNIIPITDNLYTLGSPTFSWANLYVGANHAPVLDTVSGNIGYYARTAAEIAAGVIPTNFSYPTTNLLDPRRYGAVGDNVNDDTVALQNWFSVLGQSSQKAFGYLPAGTYKYTANLTAPANVDIRGAGSQLSILKPAAAVTIALTIGDVSKLGYVQIDCSALAAGSIGLLVGNTLASVVGCIDVQVKNCTGVGSYGLQIKDVVSAKFIQCVFQGNSSAALIQGDAGYPTTINFSSCKFRTSTLGPGVLVKTGEQVTFTDDCVFEVNAQEGLIVLPLAGRNVNNVMVDKGWFENNWGGNTAKYHVVMGDGTGMGGSIITGTIRDTFFNVDVALTCKSLDANGTAVQALNLVNPRFPTSVGASTVNIRNGATVSIPEWPVDRNYASLVLDSSGLTNSPFSVITFTPTRTGYTEVPGGGAITAAARYTRVGRRIFYNASIICTGGATIASTANTSFLSGFPVGLTKDVCSIVRYDTTADIGHGSTDTAGNLSTPTWTAAANATYYLTGSYEISA